jgi:hypothetical protein
LTALLAIDEVAKEWGTPGSREAAFEKRGFTYKDSISKTTANNWGDEYSYKYNGKDTSFVPHLTIGGKQPQNCLSIHMHWDEKRKMVVIGHVGRHKTNTTS